MNRSTIGILSLFAVMAVATACKKEYNCKCTVSTMGISVDTTVSLGKVTKKDARAECSTYETNARNAAALAASVIGISASIDCEVK